MLLTIIIYGSLFSVLTVTAVCRAIHNSKEI